MHLLVPSQAARCPPDEPVPVASLSVGGTNPSAWVQQEGLSSTQLSQF